MQTQKGTLCHLPRGHRPPAASPLSLPLVPPPPRAPIHILPTPYQFQHVNRRYGRSARCTRGSRRGGVSQRRCLFPKGLRVGGEWREERRERCWSQTLMEAGGCRAAWGLALQGPGVPGSRRQ